MTGLREGGLVPGPGRIAVSIPPTQTRHPWRATVRTVFAAVLGLLPLLPAIVDSLGVGAVPWVAGVLAVTAAVTRTLAIPAVNAWLTRYLPFLGAAPRRPRHRSE